MDSSAGVDTYASRDSSIIRGALSHTTTMLGAFVLFCAILLGAVWYLIQEAEKEDRDDSIGDQHQQQQGGRKRNRRKGRQHGETADSSLLLPVIRVLW